MRGSPFTRGGEATSRVGMALLRTRTSGIHLQGCPGDSRQRKGKSVLRGNPTPTNSCLAQDPESPVQAENLTFQTLLLSKGLGVKNRVGPGSGLKGGRNGGHWSSHTSQAWSLPLPWGRPHSQPQPWVSTHLWTKQEE